jgi:hypothetical protein
LTVVVMDVRTPEEKPQRRRFATVPGELRRLSKLAAGVTSAYLSLLSVCNSR